MKNRIRLILLLLCLSMIWAPFLLFTNSYRFFQFEFFLSYIDIPSMFCVFFPSMIHLLLLHHPRQIIRAVKNLINNDESDVESLELSMSIWRHWGLLFVSWGVVMTCWNVWQMMQYFSDSNSIFSWLQPAFLSMQYGSLLAIVFAFPAYLIIEKRLIAARISSNGLKEI
ncbi:MAG: hypothetical protein P9L94_06725 [Candidatus Hinthialibacter antarcticus]|nr:hypothetical protein [Candidatus Hinthialibacter antarcticus]